MAVTWSSYKSVGGPVNFRTGIDITYTLSGNNAVVTTRVYLGASGTAFASGGSYTVTGSDSGSGSGVSWSISGSGGSALIATLTETVALNVGSTKSFSIAATVRPSGSWPGSVSHTRSITLPARTAPPPGPLTDVSKEYDGDNRILIGVGLPTTGGPVSTVEIVRRDQVNSSFVTLANVKPGSGNSIVYVDTSARKNRNYTYAARAKNAYGVSAYVQVEANTTPDTPSIASVVRNTAPVITRAALPSNVAGSTFYAAGTWDIQHSLNGGAWTDLATNKAASAATHVHMDADIYQENRYRIRAKTRTTGGQLVSPWSAPVTLAALSVPNAPLVPGYQAMDVTLPVVATWTHREAGGGQQVASEIRWRKRAQQPPEAWQVEVGPEYTSSWTVPTAFYDPAGGAYEYQVRTMGQHPDWSPWSVSSLVTLTTAPVVGITYPTPGGTHTGSRVTASWTFHDDSSVPQARWEAALVSPTGGGSGASGPNTAGTVVELRSANNAAGSVTFTSRVEDDTAYQIWVRVADSQGLWSDWESVAFTVDYALPPKPSIEAEWHKDDGYVAVTVDAPASGAGEVPLESISVYRVTTEGRALVAEGLLPGETVTDMIPPLGTAVTYEATAFSDLPSDRDGDPVVVETHTKWVFLNHGPGFGQVARVYGNLTASRSATRGRVLHHFAGRDDPVEFRGQSRTRTYDLSAWVPAPWFAPDLTSTYDDFDALADAPAPVCVRDPEGVRMFTSVGDVNLSGHLTAKRSVSMTLTQVSWSEPMT